MRIAITAALLAAAFAAPALAGDEVTLESAVYVEKLGHTTDGRITRRIEPASRLIKGDRVVLVVEWATDEDGRPFAVTSPIPDTLAFDGSGHAGEQVSVDGGRTWGELGELKVRENGDVRRASAADVTHVRWRISSREAARGNGRIAYSAVVR